MGQKIRFYTDEHVAKAVVKGLRQREVDVLTQQTPFTDIIRGLMLIHQALEAEEMHGQIEFL